MTQLKKFNVKAGLSVGSETIVDVIDDEGNATFSTLSATDFYIYPSYTISDLRLITGNVGWTVAVSDSTPGGKHAYWDTTNSRWSYVSDDSAV